MKRHILMLQVALALVLGAASCSGNGPGEETSAEPELISIIPVSGKAGCTAVISGVNFSGDASADKVYIDGSEARILSATRNRITVQTPEHEDGKVAVGVTVNGREVPSELEFTYVTLADPELKITALKPSSGFSGDNVIIIGENFSDEVADMSVTFGGVEAKVLSASASMLSVTAPEHARGTVPVVVKNGAKTASADFTYVELMIEKNYPEEGGAGTLVTIYGEGFSEEAARNVVTVGDKALTVKEATATALKVEMPELGTGTWEFTVKVGDRQCTGGKFTVAALWYVETVAGNAKQGCSDGIGKAAVLGIMQHMVTAPDGTIWMTQRGGAGKDAIRSLNPETWEVKTVIGTDNTLLSGAHPWGMAFDSKGNCFIAAKAKGKIFKVSAGTETLSEVALPAHKLTTNPMCVLVDKEDNLYVLNRNSGTAANPSYISVYDKDLNLLHDWPVLLFAQHMAWNRDMTKIIIGTTGKPFGLFEFDPSAGTLAKIAGTEDKPANAAAVTDGESGNPLTATIGVVEGIAFDGEGNLWFSDVTTATVRVLIPSADGGYAKGTVKTRAGISYKPQFPGVDGLSTNATFKYPCGLLPMDDGTMLLADGTGFLIRRIYSK